MLNKEDYRKRVTDYVMKNASNYTEQELTYMISNYSYGLYNRFAPSVLNQIYDEVGLKKESDNMYIGFVDLLEKEFNIDSNILEVGGGVIPVIGKHISLRQKNGTITVYDPRLYGEDSKYERLILKKQKFDENVNLDNIDMLIGFMPCEATETLIERACENGKDFLVALCEGGNHDGYFEYYDEDEWREHIFYLAKRKIKENNLGEFVEADLKKYGDPYPVIYNKRKKLK